MVRRVLSASARAITGAAWSSRRVAVVSIAGSWTLYLAFIATRLAITGFSHEGLLLQRHLVTASVGAAITALLYLLLRRLRHAPVVLRISVALLLALPAAGLLAVVNFEFLFAVAPQAIWGHPQNTFPFRGIFAHTILELYLVFANWGTLYTSVTSAVESREAQRLAAVSQAEARTAQLQALRYQLNPHFIFNALNSVSALVMRGDQDGAEHTIQALSAFLRSALAPEAIDDTTLADEIALQQLYLDIEQVRFGDRLRVHWSVPEWLQPALLPPMLLQPLVENVIRHAVAPARETVTMTVGAFAENSRLHLLVEDDGAGDGVPTSHGIGLRNAAARLATRYGEAARCLSGRRPGGGFRVELVLPLHISPKER